MLQSDAAALWLAGGCSMFSKAGMLLRLSLGYHSWETCSGKYSRCPEHLKNKEDNRRCEVESQKNGDSFI